MHAGPTRTLKEEKAVYLFCFHLSELGLARAYRRLLDNPPGFDDQTHQHSRDRAVRPHPRHDPSACRVAIGNPLGGLAGHAAYRVASGAV